MPSRGFTKNDCRKGWMTRESQMNLGLMIMMMKQNVYLHGELINSSLIAAAPEVCPEKKF